MPQADPGAEQNTVQQQATETSGVEHKEGAGGEPVDEGQANRDFSSLRDSPDTENGSLHPDGASSSGETQTSPSKEIAPEGLAKEQEEAVTQDLGGCIQN